MECCALWGFAGELRWDGALPGVGGSGRFRRDAQADWVAGTRPGAIATWGVRTAHQLGWHEAAGGGITLVADAALYVTDTLAAELGVPSACGLAELLAHGYLKWGEDLPSHLDGDFAFVVLDWARRRVFAATDGLGVRPLFYRYVPGQGLAFATEQWALADWVGLDTRIPESRLLEPLFSLQELSYFRPEIPGVSRLIAGHSCRADAASLTLRRYWRPWDRRPDIGEHETARWVEGLRSRVERAVHKRVVGGMPVGVTFSGGMDSSSILALAARTLPKGQLTAYSVVNRGDAHCPETAAVDAVLAAITVPAKQFDVARMHNVVEDALRSVARVPRFYLGLNGFNALFDEDAASKGPGIMMNGINADALFEFSDFVSRQLRRGKLRHLLHVAQRADRLVGVPWLVPEVWRTLRRLPIPRRVLEHALFLRRRAVRKDTLHRKLLCADAKQSDWLERCLLEWRSLQVQFGTDRGAGWASMMHCPIPLDGIARFWERSCQLGIEMRAPYLDRDVVEFSAWIPLELRFRYGRLKWIQRKAMAPYLPHAVTWRGDKFHPGSHFDRVMLQPVLEGAVKAYKGSGPAIAPYIDRDAFLHEAERWQSGAIEAVWSLRALLVLEHWLQHNASRVAFGQ